MKLWMKLVGIAFACMMLAFSVCLYLLSSWQTGQVKEKVENESQNTITHFCDSFTTKVLDSSCVDSPVVIRSIAQYYFAEAARSAGANEYYSFVHDGKYLYHTDSYDPLRLLPLSDDQWEECGVFQQEDYICVAARVMYLQDQNYTIYLCRDVSDDYVMVKDTTQQFIVMLLSAALLMLIISIPLVKRALRPMERLRRTAEDIAGGEYHLRAEVESRDEVAALARSFNSMAGSLEEKISELIEKNERQRLLLGALSHELKTPMTSIIGFADSMIKMPLDEEQKLHCARKILTAGQRTERISQKLSLLLSLGNDKSLDISDFELEPFADELRQLYDDRVVFKTVGSMSADRDLMFSLVQNLINNALNAQAHSVRVELCKDFVCVTDDADGISAEHIGRLIEPFYRVDKARSRKLGGSGLGLSLCKAITEAHGGCLSIESEPGAGTKVTIAINRTEAEE